MFCQQCGNEMKEGDMFCRKCGTKVADGDVFLHTENTTAITEDEQIVSNVSQSVIVDDFKNFVDGQLLATTKFQSADQLLNNSRPWIFAFICFGVFAIIGLAMGGLLGMLVLGLFFGYAATFIASEIIRANYRRKFNGKFAGEIDVEKLILFLNKYLPQIHSDFHEWGHLKKSGINAVMENAVAKTVGEIRICSEFGEKKKTLVVFCIRSQKVHIDSAETLYFVDALKNGFMIDGRAAGFFGHGTLIRTAPILHAAMEYYLKQIEGGKINVLF